MRKWAKNGRLVGQSALKTKALEDCFQCLWSWLISKQTMKCIKMSVWVSIKCFFDYFFPMLWSMHILFAKENGNHNGNDNGNEVICKAIILPDEFSFGVYEKPLIDCMLSSFPHYFFHPSCFLLFFWKYFAVGVFFCLQLTIDDTMTMLLAFQIQIK